MTIIQSRQQFLFEKTCFIENWPLALAELSLRQVGVPLSAQQARALGSQVRGFEHYFHQGGMLSIDDLHEPLASGFMQFSEGCFVRLGSRSPKDSDLAIATGMRVHSVSTAIRMLTDGSARIAADLLAALNFGYSPYIFLREWLDIELWFEFRCFIVNRSVVGISQADGHLGKRYPDLIEQSSDYESIIRTFCAELIQALHA